MSPSDQMRADLDTLRAAATDVIAWVDDLWPCSEPGTQPAPVFQALRQALSNLEATPKEKAG